MSLEPGNVSQLTRLGEWMGQKLDGLVDQGLLDAPVRDEVTALAKAVKDAASGRDMVQAMRALIDSDAVHTARSAAGRAAVKKYHEEHGTGHLWYSKRDANGNFRMAGDAGRKSAESQNKRTFTKWKYNGSRWQLALDNGNFDDELEEDAAASEAAEMLMEGTKLFPGGRDAFLFGVPTSTKQENSSQHRQAIRFIVWHALKVGAIDGWQTVLKKRIKAKFRDEITKQMRATQRGGCLNVGTSMCKASDPRCKRLVLAARAVKDVFNVVTEKGVWLFYGEDPETSPNDGEWERDYLAPKVNGKKNRVRETSGSPPFST